MRTTGTGYLIIRRTKADIKNYHILFFYPFALLSTKKVPSVNQNVTLSEKQKTILSLLKQGFSVKEIAEGHLLVSVSSVEKSLSMLRKLFGVSTNVELISSFLNR